MLGFKKHLSVTTRLTQLFASLNAKTNHNNPKFQSFLQVVAIAQNDLLQKQEIPQIVAARFTNTIYQYELKTPPEVTDDLAAVRKLISSNGYGYVRPVNYMPSYQLQK